MSKIFQVNIGFTRQIGLSSFDKVGGFIAIEDGEDVCVELDKHAATLYGWLAKRNPHILDEGTVTIEKKEHLEDKTKLEPCIITIKQYSNAEKNNDIETMDKLKQTYNI